MDRLPFLAVGHTSRDEFPDGRWRLGGTALYGAATAARLGAQVTLVTRVGPTERGQLETLCAELGIGLHALPSPVTTTFVFSYDEAGRRSLRLRDHAAPIARADLPRSKPAPRAILLASIAGELDDSLFAPVKGSARVLAAQGFLRTYAADGLVMPHAWDGFARLLPKVDAVVVSEEDGAEWASWLPHTTVIVTQAERGADLYAGGKPIHVPAFAVPDVVDPTGAGDAFAAGLAIGLADGLDGVAAATFASAVASFAVEGLGIARLADRTRVDARLAGGAR